MSEKCRFRIRCEKCDMCDGRSRAHCEVAERVKQLAIIRAVKATIVHSQP